LPATKISKQLSHAENEQVQNYLDLIWRVNPYPADACSNKQPKISDNLRQPSTNSHLTILHFTSSTNSAAL